jgi:protocatechuate 3,4-dioxygenase, alpha subunit
MTAVTPSQTVGPFWHLLERPGGRGAGDGAASLPRVRVEGVVLDGDGAPVTDALLELWQPVPGRTAFARAATDAAGRYAFDVVRPAPVPGPGGRVQAPHLLVAVFARGLLDHLYCRIYFADEPGNDGDPILERVPPARRGTLIATAVAADSGAHYRFDIHLQGDAETVFFRC